MTLEVHDNYTHGVRFHELPDSSIPELNSFQYNLLQKLQPDKESWDFFLQPKESDFVSPFLLPDLLESIPLLKKATSEKWHILLFGDRDTDGVSSASILGRYFSKTHEKKGGRLTVKTSSLNDEYGLCKSVMDFILELKPDLLITLDLGSSNYSEINILAEAGIQIVVIDHHEIPKSIPNCFLINPKRLDSEYPEKKICTSVLSLKVILSLIFSDSEIYQKIVNSNLSRKDKISRLSDEFFLYLQGDKKIRNAFHHYVSLSAIGTITDMMPLTGENRIIVKEGCTSLSKNSRPEVKKNPGLYSLIQNLSINSEKITSKEIGWVIGPVLNAAGRMGKTEVATGLLLSDDEYTIQNLTQELIKINTERKERTNRNIEKVKNLFLKNPEKITRKVIFCYDPELEPGVSGIVATKLTEEFKRPAIFITPETDNARGSIRSYKDENVLELLEMVSELLLHFGGHQEAGGFSIKNELVQKLEEKIVENSEIWLNKMDLSTGKILESAVSFRSNELKESLYKDIEIFEPFGQGNESPVLSIISGKIINFTPIGDGTHARFQLLGCDPKIKFVIWRKAKELESLISKKDSIDLWGVLEENYFNKRSFIQFIVRHYR
ncbi:MAG: single-stranded-DNA-specific exonuclease RecJ [Leptospiraceae bacterium]|nr:single-stranded-DNA-specific exonuclease RecJ [Leptospiraceae bacterium]MCK6382459.1 single-stranded-DNA-specific exonuclease RecJ [Leptospiraceae bacterium]